MEKALYQLYDELRFLHILATGKLDDELLKDVEKLLSKYATLADDCYESLREEEEIDL